MKTRNAALLFGVAVSAFDGGLALAAADGQGFVDSAEVVRVRPIYETVEVNHPVRECWSERVVDRHPHRDSYTGTIAGGIIGGVVGNRLGRGHSGQTVLTLAGGLLGASIGQDLSQGSRRPRVTAERHCELVDRYEYQEQIVGYRVKYRYRGRTFVTRTLEHPGDRIGIRVEVKPVHRS